MFGVFLFDGLVVNTAQNIRESHRWSKRMKICGGKSKYVRVCVCVCVCQSVHCVQVKMDVLRAQLAVVNASVKALSVAKEKYKKQLHEHQARELAFNELKAEMALLKRDRATRQNKVNHACYTRALVKCFADMSCAVAKPGGNQYIIHVLEFAGCNQYIIHVLKFAGLCSGIVCSVVHARMFPRKRTGGL